MTIDTLISRPAPAPAPRSGRAALPAFGALVAVVIAALWWHGPIAQWADYHAFADARPWLGIPNAAAFDVNNGCAGFTTALATADHAVRAGAARHALVIGAERMSDITDWTDRSTCVLLGDGAGAAVLSAADDAHVGPVVWGSDPGLGNAVRILDEWHPTFAQDGQTVFRWATTQLPSIAIQACEKAGVAPKELGAIVTHQANLRIIEAVVRQLDVPDVLVAQDVVESGNTSAASIPIALAKLVARGEISPGAPVLLLGFGGGLSWAGQVVTCPA